MSFRRKLACLVNDFDDEMSKQPNRIVMITMHNSTVHLVKVCDDEEVSEQQVHATLSYEDVEFDKNEIRTIDGFSMKDIPTLMRNQR